MSEPFRKLFYGHVFFLIGLFEGIAVSPFVISVIGRSAEPTFPFLLGLLLSLFMLTKRWRVYVLCLLLALVPLLLWLMARETLKESLRSRGAIALSAASGRSACPLLLTNLIVKRSAGIGALD